MKTFFDSSAYAKRFIEEIGSQQIDDLCQNATAIGLSMLCLPEIISALTRRLREKGISKGEYQIAKRRLVEEMVEMEIINITPKVVGKAVTLLEHNVLRAMDALHIACAIESQADLFVTADSRQAKAAKKAKLSILLVK